MMAPDWPWPAALGFLGLIFGSFIATYAVRWPQGRSALAGRSQCDGCGRGLAAAELVPLLSWIALRGRCRTCGQRIAPAHPAIEALALATGVAAGALAPGWDGVAGAVFGWLLLALGAIDLACFRLPDGLNALLGLTGLATGLMEIAPPIGERLIGGIAGFAVLWLAADLYRRLRGRVGLGGGDAKLFGAIGLWLGWRDLAPVMLIASGLGLAAVAFAILRGATVERTDRLPLGTLLALGGFILWAAARI